MDGLIELFDEEVHVIATPVVDIPDTVIIQPELLRIGNGLALHRIGIEIVVHVDAVDIVAGDDVLGHLTDIFTVLWHAGIEDKHIVVGKARHRLSDSNMVRCQLLGSLRLGAIGIDPGVKLHPTLMALSNHPL